MTQPPLVVEHLDKHRWMIHTQESQWVCVQYRLYAREMSVRTNWVERDFGFITGAAAFPFVRGRETRPIMVLLELLRAMDQCSHLPCAEVELRSAHRGAVG